MKIKTLALIACGLVIGCADMNYIATEIMDPNQFNVPSNPDAPESSVELLVRDNWTLWSGWTEWHHEAYFDNGDECMDNIRAYLEQNQEAQVFCAGLEGAEPMGWRQAKRGL